MVLKKKIISLTFGVIWFYSIGLSQKLTIEGVNYQEVKQTIINGDKSITTLVVVTCPDFIWEEELFNKLNKLKSIKIINSKINYIPKWISNFNLNVLDFSQNSITNVDLSMLNSKYIKLSYNKNITLSSSAINTNIEWLEIRGSNLKDSDFSVIMQCVNLKHLDLDQNLIRLENIDSSDKFINVRILTLSYNKCIEFTKKTSLLFPNLVRLNVQGNPLKRFELDFNLINNMELLSLFPLSDTSSLRFGRNVNYIESLYLPFTIKELVIDNEYLAISNLTLTGSYLEHQIQLKKLITDSLIRLNISNLDYLLDLSHATKLTLVSIKGETLNEKIIFLLNSIDCKNKFLEIISINISESFDKQKYKKEFSEISNKVKKKIRVNGLKV